MREVAMELKNLKGNTNWIRGGTNTGVYVFEDNTALLIDVGLGGDRPEKLIKIFKIAALPNYKKPGQANITQQFKRF